MTNKRIDHILLKLQRGEWLTPNEKSHISNHLTINPEQLNTLTPEQSFSLNLNLSEEQASFSPLQQAQEKGLDPAELYRRMAVTGDTVPGVYFISQGNAWGSPQGFGMQVDGALKDRSFTGGTMEFFENKKDQAQEQAKTHPMKPVPRPEDPLLETASKREKDLQPQMQATTAPKPKPR